MRRFQPYYRQMVTHGEVDGWHDAIEQGDWDLVVDHDTWGVMGYGLTVTQQGVPDMTVLIQDGMAYDETGQRIPVTGGPHTVDIAAHEPGVPGDERYVAIYVEHDTTASDARVDGNGVPLDYQIDESFAFHVEPGLAGVPPQVPPAIVPNMVLLAVVHMTNGMGSIVNADIDMTYDPPGTTSRQEGGVAAFGRDLLKTLFFSPGLVTRAIDTGGLHIEMGNTGDITDARGVYSAIPDTSFGRGHIYGDDSGTLFDVDKYESYDASHFLPASAAGGGGIDPWENIPAGLINNNWYLAERAAGALTSAGELLWRMQFQFGGAGTTIGLYCALTGVPHGAKLIEAKVGYVVDGGGFGANHFLQVYLVRQLHASPATLTLLGSGPASVQGAVGWQTVVEPFAVGANQIVDKNFWSYYLIVVHEANGAMGAAEDICGIRNAIVHYHIREASGLY